MQDNNFIKSPISFVIIYQEKYINQINSYQMSSYSNTQQNFNLSVNPEYSFYGTNKNTTTDGKLWQPSQTSLNFISPRISFSRQQRFKLHSIYWPQANQSPHSHTRLSKQRSDMDSTAKQISKKIDDQQKNQIRIKKKGSTHQKRIQQAFSESTKKKHQMIRTQMKRFMLDQKNMQITQRLASSSPKKQSLLRDRNGIRSNLIHGDDQHLHGIVNCEVQKMAQSTGFKEKIINTAKIQTMSKRINLNLPHNYYPGVGTYEIKRYLQELDNLGKRRAVTARQLCQKKQI